MKRQNFGEKLIIFLLPSVNVGSSPSVNVPQFKEFLLNLSKGQEDLKTLFAENLTKERPDNTKDEQLEQLQAEVEAMRTQMLRQMDLIQGLARGQEEMRAIIKKLHQEG